MAFDIGPTRAVRSADLEQPTLDDVWTSSIEDARKVTNQNAAYELFHGGFNEVNDQISRATGKALSNPLGPLETNFSDVFRSLYTRGKDIETLSGVEAWKKEIEGLRVSHPDALDWDEMLATPARKAWSVMKATRENASDVSERRGLADGSQMPGHSIPYVGPFIGAGGALVANMMRDPAAQLTQIAAGLAGSLSSPIDTGVNLISFGAGGKAVSIARNAALNASINMAAQMPLSALKMDDYKAAGLPYGWRVWAEEVAGAGVAGGLLDAGVRAPARLYRVARGTGAGQGGVFRDAVTTPELPAPPPVREPIAPEVFERARQNDIEAIREIATKSGAIEDPLVKGALDFADMGGKVDADTIARLREMNIDSGEGLATLAAILSNPDAYSRTPEPLRQAAAPLQVREAMQLATERGADIQAVTAGLDPALSRLVTDGLEAGIPRVVAAVREVVAAGVAKTENASQRLSDAIQKAADDAGGMERLSAEVAIHAAADPVQAAAAMRAHPDLVDSNVRLDTDFMRTARALQVLDGDAWAMVSQGEAPPALAAEVANFAPPGQHGRVLDDLMKSGARTREQARAVIPDLIRRDGPAPLARPGIDDPAGPEAEAQTKHLEERHKEAVDEAMAPIKERKKLESKVEDLRGEIAKLEEPAKPKKGGEQMFAIPDAKLKKLAKAREDLADAEAGIDTIKARGTPELYALVMEARAVRRERDMLRAIDDALRLASRILPEGTAVRVTDALESEGVRLDASSDTRTGDIALATYALNPAARLGHEGVHTLVTRGLVSPAEVGLLEAAGREAGLLKSSWEVGGKSFATEDAAKAHAKASDIAEDAIVPRGEAAYRKAYKDRASLEQQVSEEFAAHYVEAVIAGKIKKPDTALARIVKAIQAAIERVKNALSGAGYKTADDIAAAILNGEAARRAPVQRWMRANDITAMAVRPMAALGDAPSIGALDSALLDIANNKPTRVHGALSSYYIPTSAERAKAAAEMAKENGYTIRAEWLDRIANAPTLERLPNYNGYAIHRINNPRKGESDYILSDPSGVRIASATMNGNEIGYVSTNPKFQRQGFASMLYDAIEANAGIKLVPSGELIHPGSQALWLARDPETVSLVYGPSTEIGKRAREIILKRQSDSANLMFAFAGERAKTADLDALARAKEMDGKGEDRTKIWTDTGWFRGVDGKWRFEIDDSGAAVFSGPMEMTGKSEHGAPFRDRMMHTNYLNAYPDAEKLTVQRMSGKQHPQFSNGGGYFDGQGFWMDGAQPDGGRGIAIHEIQHDAQHREAFARGGSIRGFAPDEIAAERARIIQSDDGNGWTSVGNSAGDMADTEVARRLYNRLAGEVDARTVQKRMDMTADERRARPPWQDYDVPEDQQIVRFADGKSVSQMSYGSEPPVEGPAMRGLKMFAIRAYHGSGHDFDRFDMRKVGRGEGGQKYTYGLYFAQAEAVARRYMDAGGTYPIEMMRPEDYANRILKWWGKNGTNRQEAIRHIDTIIADYGSVGERIIGLFSARNRKKLEVIKAARQALVDGTETKGTPQFGILYEVNIKADIGAFLDWDMPLSGQPQIIRDAIARASRGAVADTMTGEQALKQIAQSKFSSDEVDDPRLARELRGLGISGVAYLDAESRSSGRGTKNMVVYDDSLIEIVAKDGKPIEAAERQSVIDGMSGRQDAPDTGKMFAMGDQPVTPGLDMSPEARKKRAEAMGFDTGRVLYHGSTKAFDQFSPLSFQGSKQSVIWLTPSQSIADIYNKSRSADPGYPAFPEDGGLTYPVFIRPGRVLEVDARGSDARVVGEAAFSSERFGLLRDEAERAGVDRNVVAWIGDDSIASDIVDDALAALHRSSLDPGQIAYLNLDPYTQRVVTELMVADARSPGFIDRMDAINQSRRGTDDLIDEAARQGYDTIEIKRVFDNGGHQTQVVVLDPSNIRSVNAAFDPANAASPNLMFALNDNPPPLHAEMEAIDHLGSLADLAKACRS